MARRDKIHQIIIEALEKDGWTITHDPFRVKLEKNGKAVEMDLGAEKFVEAKRDNDEIVIEIKSFLDLSLLNDLYDALGKYLSYRSILRQKNIERDLFLAISTITHYRIKQSSVIHTILEDYDVNLVIIDLNTITVKEWIN